MKKMGWAAFVLIACLGLSRCSLVRTKPMPPPVSSVFPLVEESRVVYDGEINRMVQNSGGRLIFSTRKGLVYCVDSVKKDILWKFSGRSGISEVPWLSEGRVFCSDQENRLYCLDEAGKAVWGKTLEEKISSGIGQDQGKVLAGTQDGNILALDSSTGAEAWRFKSESAIQSGPVFWNRQIIFGTADGRLLFLAANGRWLAAFKTKAGIRGPLFVDSNRLFYSLEDHTFNSLNLKSRRRRWATRTGGFMTAPPAVDDRRIYFVNSNSVLFCLDKRGGEILWWRPLPSPSYFKPGLCGEEILTATLSGLLLGFYKKNGEKSGALDSGQDLRSNPLVLNSSLVINLYNQEGGQGILVFFKRAGVSPTAD